MHSSIHVCTDVECNTPDTQMYMYIHKSLAAQIKCIHANAIVTHD